MILASGSPARRDLLKRAGYDFDVLPARIEEPTGETATDPRAHVQEVAWLKAAAVVPQVKDGIVLAADTVGWLHGKIIGKPADENDARRILRTLGGTEHQLWTGMILWRRPDDLQVAWQEVSRVFFKRLTDDEIDNYLATRTWEGCSGAYAIQEKDDPFVKLVEGSLTNVIGLPMERLAWILSAVGERRGLFPPP